MPKLNDLPITLKIYDWFGLELQWYQGKKDAITKCLWCDRDDKLSILAETGQYRCVVCKEKGNDVTFIRYLWEISAGTTRSTDYEELRVQRKLLTGQSLEAWGLRRSAINGEWLAPSFNVRGEVCNLYRWVRIKEKRRLLACPKSSDGIRSGVFGVNLFNWENPVVYLCEGIWDGIAWWTFLRSVKRTESGYQKTENPAESLLATESNVIAVPGCGSFSQEYAELFAGGDVVLLYHNDYPKVNEKTGQPIESAGLAGAKRTAKLLLESRKPPLSISYLPWGDSGFVNQDRPSGWDIRDQLNA